MGNLLSGAASALSSLLAGPDLYPPDSKIQSGLSLSWNDNAGKLHVIRFDVVRAETHESLMVLSDHPVETGSNVTDNARELPKTIALEAYVSNKPMADNPVVGVAMTPQQKQLNIGTVGLKPSLASVVSAIGAAISPPANTATVLQANGTFPKSRPALMFEALEEARAGIQFIRVVTALRTLDNMLITRVSVPRTLKDGSGATFSVELKQVKLVSSQNVKAPETSEGFLRGMPTVSTGSKATTPTDDTTDEVASSLLLQGSIKAGLQE